MSERKTCRDPIKLQRDNRNKATGFCKWCDKIVPPSKPRKDGKGVKPRIFCDDACSRKWWNTRRNTGNPPGGPRKPGRGKRFWTYGLLDIEVAIIWEAQGRACPICYSFLPIKDINIDHCHFTDQVRGILCGFCNRGLGMFKDDPEALMRAANYLKESRSGNENM